MNSTATASVFLKGTFMYEVHPRDSRMGASLMKWIPAASKPAGFLKSESASFPQAPAGEPVLKISLMIELLITLLIIIIIFGVIYYAITIIPLPPPFRQIAMLVVLVIFLIVLLAYLLPLVHVRSLP